METIDKYSIYCTEEQTKKALELGAPIKFEMEHPLNFETLEKSPYPDIKVGKDGEPILITTTAEQMIGWLEEQKEIDEIAPIKYRKGWVYIVWMARWLPDIKSPKDTFYHTRRDATLAAIDAALDYLIKNKK